MQGGVVALPRAAHVLRAAGAAVCVAVSVIAVATPAAASARRDLSVLEQGYSTSLPVDAYNDQGTDLHVAEVGGSPAYRSYIAFSTASLAAGDVVEALTLSLLPDPASNGNQNTGAAMLQACPLARAMPTPFDPADPPPDACSASHVLGKAAADGTWSFDLRPVFAYWLEHGANTGVAVLPAGAGPGDAWSVSFTAARTRVEAQVTPALTSAPAPADGQPVTPEPTSAPPGLGGFAPAPPYQPGAPSPLVVPRTPLVAAGPTPAPVDAPVTTPAAVVRPDGATGISPWWLVVAFALGAAATGALVLTRGGGRQVKAAWAALAPPAPDPARTPRRITLPGRLPLVPRSLRLESVVNTAVLLAVLVLAFTTAAARLPHGAPAGIVLLGLTVGSLNGLLGVGLVLIYRATRVINFAQGALGAFAAVLAFELMAVMHWPWVAAVPLSLLAAVAMSALLEFAFLRRLRTAPRTLVTVATIGLAQIMLFLQLVLQPLFEQTADEGVSAIGSRFPSPFSRPFFTLFPVLFRGDHLLILCVVPVVLFALNRFLARSWTGMGIRGIAENSDRATMLGWPAPRLATTVWAIAGLLSGIAALLQAPVAGFADTGSAGPGLIVRGLAAAAIGRMVSIPVTFVAALGLGVVEQLVFFNYSRTGPMDGLLLAVILVAFLSQSRQLGRSLWQEASSWRAVREVRPLPAELRNLLPVRAARQGGPALLLLLAVAAPSALGLAHVRLLAVVYVYAMVGLSLVVLTGWSGQISLGQWGIAGVGAFSTAWLTNHTQLNFVLVLLAGAACAAVVSIVLGLPALRIRGIFAGITTLAFAIAAGEWLFTFSSLEPGRLVARPHLSWLDLRSERAYYYVALGALVVCLLMARNLRLSRMGRLLIAVRDNEQSSASYGVSPTVVRVTAFAVSGVIGGIAGGVYALLVQRAEPADFGATTSLFVFAIVVIGGLGSVTGALLGAAYVQSAQYFLPGWARFLATGIGMLLLLMAAPGGLSQLVYDARDRAVAALGRRRETPATVVAVDSAA
jgi:branched-chain amino acid transport system permease protein